MARSTSVLSNYPEYRVDIGMEIHVQLTTKSKIFCSDANEITHEPNKNICQICSGYPGTLPVLNKEVVNMAILLGLATNCEIAPISTFARKHYFYPDLPKGYQITQGEVAICSNGYIEIRKEDGTPKKIRINRIHIEEDAGKNVHADDSDESFVNLNRAGTPLLEVVTEPDIESAYETKAYLKALRNIVLSLNISTANMEDGAFRGDTNISVRKKTSDTLGTRCEMKNINSFKYIGDAIEHEIERHIELIEDGGAVTQETRLWDSKNKRTVKMRSKEEAADYRLFQDPDLPLMEVGPEWIERIRNNMPELPIDKFARLQKNFGISIYEADILIDNANVAQYYEAAMAAYPSSHIINWVLRDVLGYTNDHKISLGAFQVTPEKLAAIIKLLDTDAINGKAAREVFEAVAETGGEPADIVKERGLEQIGSADELEAIVKGVIDANQTSVTAYKAGKDRLLGFFIGQAMKATQGKGNPKLIQELVKKHLNK